MFNNEKEKNIKSFNDAAKEAKKVKDETVSYVKENAEEALDQAKYTAREAGKNVYNFFKRNSTKLKDAEENAVSTIRTNPLASAAAIFATGLVVGAILKRSRKA
jgi:ElaB/YqjD/DUF883 family membrane-anchored ribosome-binding protein